MINDRCKFWVILHVRKKHQNLVASSHQNIFSPTCPIFIIKHHNLINKIGWNNSVKAFFKLRSVCCSNLCGTIQEKDNGILVTVQYSDQGRCKIGHSLFSHNLVICHPLVSRERHSFNSRVTRVVSVIRLQTSFSGKVYSCTGTDICRFSLYNSWFRFTRGFFNFKILPE